MFQTGEKLRDGVYYHSWKQNNDSSKTSSHLALSISSAREFIELCNSGIASQNKGDMLAMIIQLEQGALGGSSGSKVMYRVFRFNSEWISLMLAFCRHIKSHSRPTAMKTQHYQ
jgi:hypothetical protein